MEEDIPKFADDRYLLPPSVIQDLIDRALDQGVTLVRAEMDVITQRLDDMVRATELFSNDVRLVTQREINHVRELMGKDFAAVALRFNERDERFAVKDTDSKLAIDKAEMATKETINKNADLTNKSIEALTTRLDDIKERVLALEAEKRGGMGERTERRASNAAIYAGIAAIGGIISILIIVVGFIIDGQLST